MTKPSAAPEAAAQSEAEDDSASLTPIEAAVLKMDLSRLLSREDILAADDIERDRVEVPEWGGTVIVRGLTGTDRDAFEEAITQMRGKSVVSNLANFRAKLVARAIVDENDKRMFTDVDVTALGKKSAKALQRVFRRAQELSGLADDEVEELTKALGEDSSAGSGSD